MLNHPIWIQDSCCSKMQKTSISFLIKDNYHKKSEITEKLTNFNNQKAEKLWTALIHMDRRDDRQCQHTKWKYK